MRSRSVSGFLVTSFAVGALVVITMFVLLLFAVSELRTDNDSARRTSDLLIQSFQTERSVIDLETGLRGFLLTGRPQFLAPYEQARAVLPTRLSGLERSTPGAQQGRAMRLARMIQRYISGYAQPLIAHPPAAGSAAEVAATARGKQLLDALRGQISAFSSVELTQRAKQRADTEGSASRATLIAAIGFALSLLLLGVLLVYLLRSVVGPIRQVAQAAERLRTGDLEVRVSESGSGEVGRLGASFNEMASSIQNRDRQLSQAKQQLELAVTAAEEASLLKSNFLANMSHEIRTPLNGVVGMISLLGETSLTQEQREYVEVARSSSDALMRVVSDVLDVAKIEAGRLQVENRDFDLHEVVEASCEMVAASALTKGVELQSYVHEDVPRRVIGDRTRVGQILVNLLANAVKFTAEGEVALEVGVAAHGVRLTTVQFEVRDTGIGIDPARIKQLFEPFAQADATTTRRFGGTGLGLAISLELARLMGGGIQAQSKVGTGSSFRVRIPFARSRSQLRAPAPPTRLRGLRVLVVDDSATNRRVFEAYLTSWEMRSEAAIDAADAYGRLQSAVQQGDPFDLVLLDLNMPGESGIELASRIRQVPSLRWTRVILLTSSPSAGADDAEAGIDAQLTKPVRQSRLLDIVSAVMAHDRAAASETKIASSLLSAPNESLSDGNGSPATTGRRILVAEDQPVNWMLIERLLQKRGHRAAHATDGRQALEILAAEQFDLVLMDCQMPELDGYQVAREVRRREVEADRARLPIVAMTAHALQGDRERCLAAGMDDYMAKPISAAVLDRVLSRWLAVPLHEGAELSRDRVEELRSLFPGSEFERMLRDVAAEIEADVEQIAAAVDRDDLPSVAAAAHRLKGSARLVGAALLAEAADALDRQARAGQAASGIADSVTLLRERWSEASAAVTAETSRTA